MNTSTYVVDRARWSKMSIFDQMGNIYSEVGRSINAKKRGDIGERDQAVARALDLFDATVDSLVDQKSPRTKEVLRAKDQYLHVIYDDHDSAKDTADLDRYFLQFAIAARLHKKSD